MVLGEHLPPVRMRAANFHFREGDIEQALKNTSRVLEMVSEYDAIIFGTYRRMGIPIETVLSEGIPPQSRAASSFLRNLLSWAKPGDAGLAWKNLVKYQYNDDQLATQYIEFLLRRHLYDKAAEVWTLQLGERRGTYRIGNYVLHGSFEEEPTGAPFDWRVRKVPGVEVERDGTIAWEGRYSLRLVFGGDRDILYRHTSQLTYLPPGRYRLRAWVRSNGLTTDQGVYVRVFDRDAPRRLNTATEQVRGTRDWGQLRADFVVPVPGSLVAVEICRDESLRIDSKIRGTAWIDAVALAQGPVTRK